MKRLLHISIYLFCVTLTFAQGTDTLRTRQLNEVLIKGQSELNTVSRLPDIHNTYIWAGKKNEVINVQNLDANITEKTPRQIFAKVPGVFVYDMDGTGNQLNIAARGLDPHRGWEFNIRRNNAITNSDMYAYPASHYSIPMEAIERIEFVRGTASLQYGAQFGGMLNYVTKEPDSTKAITFESINAGGSFGLFSTYNAISGTIGKFQYYTYFTHRKSDGFRENSESDYDAQSIMLVYNASSNFKITGELSRSNYIYQTPGPLTDSMFHANPKMSTRARNYFNPEIYVPSIKLEWKIGKHTRMQWLTSAVLGDRNSVQFDRPDAVNPIANEYAPRQVDIDHFNSYTSELRFSHEYGLFNHRSVLVGGVQIMNNDLNRQQQGKGTTGTDFDLSLTDPNWGRDMHLKTKNVALFVENNFKLTEKLSINPGFRVEMGDSKMSGTISYYDPTEIPNTITHHFPLFGINAQYRLKSNTIIYGGWSQSYRPVLFKDIIPASVYEVVDKDLEDADGYNVELGFRGSVFQELSVLRWDVSLYQLQYNNRMGSQATVNDADEFILYRTNIGNSKTNGVEAFLEYSFSLGRNTSLSVFSSTAFMNSKYESATIRSGQENVDITGNKVESVPEVITRNGINFRAGVLSLSMLYSYTGKSFADPLNTVKPSATGAVGLVPSYGLLDINSTIRVTKNVNIRFNINNVTDEHYFTKRPTMYPGPGVWSSDGRSITASIGIKI